MLTGHFLYVVPEDLLLCTLPRPSTRSRTGSPSRTPASAFLGEGAKVSYQWILADEHGLHLVEHDPAWTAPEALPDTPHKGIPFWGRPTNVARPALGGTIHGYHQEACILELLRDGLLT